MSGRNVTNEEIHGLLRSASSEIQSCSLSVAPASLQTFSELICAKHSNHVIVHGVGRERLMLSAFAMRLYHLGMKVSVFGDMTCPPITSEDLLIVSAGPGHFSTVEPLVRTCNGLNAITICLTAHPNHPLPRMCDHVIHVQAPTMNTGHNIITTLSRPAVLPMGSAYEGTMFVLFEVVVELLRRKLNVSFMEMEKRHTNLE